MTRTTVAVMTLGLLGAWRICAASAAEPATEYQVDLQKWNIAFSHGPLLAKFTWPEETDTIEHAFSVQMDLGDNNVYTAPTHLFGRSVTVIPYANSDDGQDAAGNHYGACDSVLSQYFPPGSVGFGIMNHRPAHRKISIRQLDSDGLKDELKFQDTHVLIVVGGQRNGRPSVVAIHNPQDYLNGRFGDPDYPVLLVRPVLPEYINAATAALFRDNIRTMAVSFNAVSNFPNQYNGGDPLAARDPQHVRQHVAMMIRAIAGDQEGEAFFRAPENLIYCAELAHIASSAGLLVPLNDANVLPLLKETLGPDAAEKTWAIFRDEIRKHNSGQPSRFTAMNKNKLVGQITLADADRLASLRPAATYAPQAERPNEERKLAFKPMTMADIIEQFLHQYIPRQRLGEEIATAEAAVMRQMEPALLEAMALDPDSAKAAAVKELYGRILDVIGKSYPDYSAFRAQLDPLLEEARRMSGPRAGGPEGLFVPPSLLHLVAAGQYGGGLMRLDYVGHGIHFSLVRPKTAAAAAPQAVPAPPAVARPGEQ